MGKSIKQTNKTKPKLHGCLIHRHRSHCLRCLITVSPEFDKRPFSVGIRKSSRNPSPAKQPFRACSVAGQRVSMTMIWRSSPAPHKRNHKSIIITGRHGVGQAGVRRKRLFIKSEETHAVNNDSATSWLNVVRACNEGDNRKRSTIRLHKRRNVAFVARGNQLRVRFKVSLDNGAEAYRRVCIYTNTCTLGSLRFVYFWNLAVFGGYLNPEEPQINAD